MFSFYLVVLLCLLASAVSFHSSLRRVQTRGMQALNWKVIVKHEGKETEMEVDEGTSILEAALEAGVALPHDCDLGVCLTCPAFIESGTCDQSGGTLDDSVLEAGFALTCQSFPRSDVVIRSIEEEELLDAQFMDVGKK
jgi:ferredoxin